MPPALPCPVVRPTGVHFSSGPCAKRPGWSVQALESALVGRSHRSVEGKARLRELLDRSRDLLKLPVDWRIGIVPGSDTGAVEMALWSLLGLRGVEALGWESFGLGWITDITKQLKLPDVSARTADYGHLPDLATVDFDRDVIFTWNGTTSGVRVPDGDWIDDNRRGLTICDATSAVFAMALPWHKLDVVTWSWQKVLGGEGAHGMLVLSPRAVERLESYTPSWPLPKLFRMTSGGKLIEGIFTGETINTPSMIAVEDQIDALKWAHSIGGLDALIGRSTANLAAVERWIAASDWADFLAVVPNTRSSTSICLTVKAPFWADLSQEQRQAHAKSMAKLLDSQRVACDIGSYKDSPPGLRLWGGATVETSDIEALLPWLDWAFAQIAGNHR